MAPQIPKLSDDALIGLPGAVVQAWAANKAIGREALLGTFLTYAGNVLGGRAYSKYGTGTKHPPRLFSLVVGASGSGKGSSLDEISALDRAISDYGNRPPWFISNATYGIASGPAFVEAVALRGDESSSLIIEPEFSRLLSRIKMDETLATKLMEAYDSGNLSHKVRTKGQSISVADAHVSVIGHVVPYVLRQQFSDKEFANGFANRFLFFYTRVEFDEAEFAKNPNVAFGAGVDYATWQKIVERLYKKFFGAPLVGELTWEPEAKDAYKQFYKERMSIRSKRSDTEEPSLLDKLRDPREFAHVTRLTVLYALLDESSTTIRKCHLDAALAVWDYSLSSIDYIWALDEMTSKDRLLAVLQEAFVNGATVDLIPTRNSLYGASTKAKAAFEADLNTLIASGQVVKSERKPAGGAAGAPVKTIAFVPVFP